MTPRYRYTTKMAPTASMHNEFRRYFEMVEPGGYVNAVLIRRRGTWMLLSVDRPSIELGASLKAALVGAMLVYV